MLVGVARLEESGNQAVAFVIDLTDRKRAEAEARETERRFREVQLELEHANRVATVGGLAASIAHEVNQPLAALLTNSETALRWLVRQPPNSEKSAPLIERVINDGKRAAEIISRIRDLLKKTPVRKENLEINATILGVIGLTRIAMSEQRVLATTQLSEGLPRVLGDRVQLTGGSPGFLTALVAEGFAVFGLLPPTPHYTGGRNNLLTTLMILFLSIPSPQPRF